MFFVIPFVDYQQGEVRWAGGIGNELVQRPQLNELIVLLANQK